VIGTILQVSAGLIVDSPGEPPYVVAGNARHSYILRLWLDDPGLSFLGFVFPEGERQEKQRPHKQGKTVSAAKVFWNQGLKPEFQSDLAQRTSAPR